MGSGKLLKLSVKKYGREHHIRETLSKAPSRGELYVLEEQEVAKYLGSKECMNICKGGLGAWTPEHARIGGSANAEKLRDDAEHALKFSLKQRSKRFKLSDDAKEKIRASKIGKPRSEETRAAISSTKKGKPGPKASTETRLAISLGLRGKKKSAEHIEKLREAAKRREEKKRQLLRLKHAQVQG